MYPFALAKFRAGNIKVGGNGDGAKSRPAGVIYDLKDHHSDDAFFDEMKPVLYSLKLFGRLPYEISRLKFRLMSVSTWYTVLVYLVQVCWTLETGRVIAGQLTHRSYDETLFWITTFVFLTMNISVPFTYWIDAPNMAAYFDQWKKFQEEYAVCMRGEKVKFTMKKFIMLTVVSNVPGAIVVVAMENILLVKMEWYDLVPYTFAYCTCNISILFWGCTCIELSRISVELRRKTIAAMRGSRAVKIGSCRRLWVSLSGLSRGLGPGVAFSALLTTTVLSACFILTCYALVAGLFHRQFTNDLVALVFVWPINTVHNILLVDAAHRTTAKVGTDFASAILKESTKLTDERCQKEVDLLLKAITLSPPVISLNGFITVDRTLLVSLTSNTISYLVVLLQFKNSGHNIASA